MATVDPYQPPVPQVVEPLAPVAAAERMPVLDVVRGFALLGIFLMNVEFFSRPLQDVNSPGIDPALHGLDYAADAAIFFLVQNKFWTLFSLLFGMGFAVMIDRAHRAGRPFVAMYLRRSLALLGIGLVHALLIWSGDILVSYAIGAGVLLAARAIRRAIVGEDAPPMAPRRLAAWGTVSFGLVLAVLFAIGLAGSLQAELPSSPGDTAAESKAAAERAQVRERAVLAYTEGTYAEATAQRGFDTAEQLGSLPLFLPFLLGMFLFGAAVLRSGIAEHPAEHRDALRRMRNIGLPVGLAIMALSTWLGTGPPTSGRFTLGPAVQVITYMVAGLVLALAYGATVVLALEGRAGDWLREWLAPAGRMALTNYLAQSVVGTLVFYGYGLGQWGHVGRFAQVGLVLAVFALQVLLSRWWLARFRFGPAEWVWRALTYAQLPPMRRAAAA
jgi:uncharacterized protein